MIYEFHIDGKAFHMEFEEHEEASKAVERDLYGYTYMLNDRTYQGYFFFQKGEDQADEHVHCNL